MLPNCIGIQFAGGKHFLLNKIYLYLKLQQTFSVKFKELS